MFMGLSRTWDFANHHKGKGMRTYIDYVFSLAHPEAVILANWEAYTGLLYAQQVESQRLDVMLVSVTRDEWRRLLPPKRAERPAAQILLSFTLPYDKQDDMIEMGSVFPLSIKGKTFQDFKHGQPDPAAERLFELR